ERREFSFWCHTLHRREICRSPSTINKGGRSMSLDKNLLEEAAALLRRAKRLVVFTGAGVSAESNIPTFRNEGGLWTDFPPEQFARWPGLLKCAASNPRRLAEFLIAVFGPVAAARPNPAHAAIAELEAHLPTVVI